MAGMTNSGKIIDGDFRIDVTTGQVVNTGPGQQGRGQSSEFFPDNFPAEGYAPYAYLPQPPSTDAKEGVTFDVPADPAVAGGNYNGGSFLTMPEPLKLQMPKFATPGPDSMLNFGAFHNHPNLYTFSQQFEEASRRSRGAGRLGASKKPDIPSVVVPSFEEINRPANMTQAYIESGEKEIVMQDPESRVISEHEKRAYHTNSWNEHHQQEKRRTSVDDYNDITKNHYIRERGWELEHTYLQSFAKAEQKHSYEPNDGFFAMAKYQNRVFQDTFKIATNESNKWDLYTNAYVRDFSRKAIKIKVPGVDTGVFATGEALKERARSLERLRESA